MAEWERTGSAQRWRYGLLPIPHGFLNSVRGHRLHAVFHLIALPGLRRGEACGLRWCDVDHDGAAAVISCQLQQYDGHITLCPPKNRTANG